MTKAQYQVKFGSTFATAVCTGPTTFNFYPAAGAMNSFELRPYNSLTYELHHYIQPCSSFISAINLVLTPWEARSEAGQNTVYRTLWKQNPSEYFLITDIPYQDVMNNLTRDAVGGGGEYREILWPLEGGAQIELFYSVFGGSLKPFDHAWNTAGSQAEFQANLDATGKRVNGVLPSTFLQYSLACYANGARGQRYLTIIADRNPGRFTAVSPGFGPVNPNDFWFPIVQRSENALQPTYLPGTVLWKITDASGLVRHQSLDNSTGPDASFETDTLPEGAYRVDACVLKTGSTTACDPAVNTETTYFLVSHDGDWWKNSMFLIGNGPDYFTLDASQSFTILDDGGAESTAQLPGLLVLKNPQRDVLVSFAGNAPRTFTPADVSTVYLATRRDQPYLYAAGNAGSASSLPQSSVLHYAGAKYYYGADSILTPGSWATLFTWGATQLDPYLPAGGAMPTQGCADGRTQVDFQTPDGVDHWAPIQYCSRGQINVQVPYELSGQSASTVYVQLGSTPSNGVKVQVASVDPAFFMKDWTTLTPAMYNWTAGTIVAPGATVKRGDWLVFYGTGLGPTNNDPATTQPAAASPVAQAATPVNLILGAYAMVGASPTGMVVGGNPVSIPASFAGLAPGFVGLYQVNVQIPQSIAPGTYYVALSQGSVSGNVAKLIIQ